MNIRSSDEMVFRQFVSLWVMNGATRHSRRGTSEKSYYLQVIDLDVPQQCCVAAENWRLLCERTE